jgi:multicomponent Na+:H+ antiporter subunit D
MIPILLSILLEHAPALMIAIPLLAAFSTPLVSKIGNRIRNLWVIISLAFVEFVAILLSLDIISGNNHFYSVGAAVPSLTAPAGFPIRIVLVADAMSGLLALVALSISLIAAIYSWRGMEGYRGLEKFYTLLLLLAAGMVGLTLTGDFFTLFVFIEIVSVSSAGLIAFFSQAESFEAAFKYMVISATGAVFLLLGVGLLYGKYGMLNMSAIASAVSTQHSFLDVAALSLLVSALLLKSGSFPVHMWKPDAYQVSPPQVVIMLLTSALLSMYVMFRICFSVFGLALPATLGWVMVILGALSIFVGVMMALPQRNLKRLIGYAAVAEIGYVMLGAGTGLITMPNVSSFSMYALSGGIFHMLNDILDLSLLFLVTGAALYITRKQDLNDVGGLAHRSGPLAVLFMIGMLAIAGLPPMGGFASKLMIYESVYFFSPMLAIVGILGSIMLLAIFMKIFASVFLGVPYKGDVRKVPKSMLFVMFVLAFFILLLGIFPTLALDLIITPAARALINTQAYIGGVL